MFCVGTSSTSPCVMSCCVGVVFSNGALLAVCGEQRVALATVWVVWRFPWDPSANNSVPVLEALLGYKRGPVGTPSPSWLGEFIRIACIYFRKFPLH